MSGQPIEFPKKKYLLEQTLGHGACGQAVVVYDDIIDERFVCKKYAPYYEEFKEPFFTNFLREIKLLYLINHSNIVRVFNYHVYPDKYLGYIFMEYVNGSHIDAYLEQYPEMVNEVFRQTIDGFSHLEKSRILHRDIRPANLMVCDTGVVKIIDFGFGKLTTGDIDYDKSISLNWWCEPPLDFEKGSYDFATEVYFVGKLFDKIIVDKNIKHFNHSALLRRMCARDPADRVLSFVEIRRELLGDKFLDIAFEHDELSVYQRFSDSLYDITAHIDRNVKYYDAERVRLNLEDCFKRVMLELILPTNSLILQCLMDGSYSFRTHKPFEVFVLRDFVNLFRSCSREKQNLILSNLQTRLDTVRKDFVDDLPF